MQFLQLALAAATALFGPPAPTNHLLIQVGDHEKTVASIDHQIAKARYNENNPIPIMLFESPFPFEWLPHTCGSECRDEFIRVKEMVLKLHADSAQNKFKAVFIILRENPGLIDFVDIEGNNLLHHATKGKHANLALALMCLRPQLAALTNKCAQTPAHLALENNPRKILLFLRAAYGKT